MGYYGGSGSPIVVPTGMELLRFSSGSQYVDQNGFDGVLDDISFNAGDLADEDLLYVVGLLENTNGDLNDWWLEDDSYNTLMTLEYSNEPSLSTVLIAKQNNSDAVAGLQSLSNSWAYLNVTSVESGFLSGDWRLRLHASWYAYPGNSLDQYWRWWVYRLRGNN